MQGAIQEGLGNSVGYRASGPNGPVVTFEQPGLRTITLGQPTFPSAPLPALPQGLSMAPSKVLPGLYEQCR